MDNERLHSLFELYISKKSTLVEETELMQLLAEAKNSEDLGDLINEFYEKMPENYKMDKSDADLLFDQIIRRPVKRNNTYFINYKRTLRWTVAAAVLIFAIIVSDKLINPKPVNEINQVITIANEVQKVKPLYKNDVQPGKDQAVLILADGTKIMLDDANNDDINRQGNSIIKFDNNSIKYHQQSNSTNSTIEPLYNTLTTPRGGQFQITLADGTLVWLNASTTLRFPVEFVGKERKVHVTGEAYFEVAKNESMPFIVEAGNQEIKVLGTHFNVTAYSDDKIIKTTLLEGKVEISLVNPTTNNPIVGGVILEPGLQSHLNEHNELTVSEANLEEAIAWKNGFFIFDDESISNIMHKLSRWYGVEVLFEDKSIDQRFTGMVSRKKNISDVLSMLEQTEEVHFKIEGKTITVIPKHN